MYLRFRLLIFSRVLFNGFNTTVKLFPFLIFIAYILPILISLVLKCLCNFKTIFAAGKMHNLKKSYATVVCGSRHCLYVSFFSLISIALLFYPDRFTVFHSEPSHLFYLLMQIRTRERRLSTPHLKPPLTSKNKNVKDRIV